MFFSFENLPPEMQEQLREQAAQMEMATSDFGHGIVRLFTESDQDTLLTLKSMMHMMAHSDNTLAAYWEGMIVVTLQWRFNLCPSHGVNHDEEIAAAMDAGEKPAGGEPSSQEAIDRAEVTPESFTKKDRELMYLFHVDDAYEDETKRFLGLVCTGINGRKEGCGMIYQSLEDRMLREPESCSGCHQKAAHG